MSEEIRIKNMNQVLAGIKKKEDAINAAAQFGIREVAINLVYETQKLLNNNPHTLRGKTWYPTGHIGGNGSAPNRRSGHLRDSFQIQPKTGFPGYGFSVFPTMVYARSLELGNPKWKSGVKYPYLEPSARMVRAKASKIFTQAFLSKYRQG
jgi:hypothetical protein